MRIKLAWSPKMASSTASAYSDNYQYNFDEFCTVVKFLLVNRVNEFAKYLSFA